MDAKPPILLNTIRDTIVLGGVLASLNYLLAKSDPGWLSLNPAPWLLLPLLIGARYGVVSGTVVGALCSAAMIWIRARIEGITPQLFATEHPYPLTAFVFAGFMTGELRQILRGRDQQLHRENARLTNQVERLDAELDVVRQTRHDLQRHLALHNAPYACLDAELNKLALLPAAQVYDSTLQLLAQVAGVISAGFYEQRGHVLHRLAVMNATAPLTTTLSVESSPLISRALAENSISAFADPLAPLRTEPFLCAIPWSEGERRGVLLVQDMPFHSCDWQNYARIELVLHWTFKVREHVGSVRSEAGEKTRFASLEDFLVLVAQLLETERAHSLPSSILRMLPANGLISLATEQQLISQLPPASIATRLPTGGIAALLPFCGINDARTLISRTKEWDAGLQINHHLVASPSQAHELWAKIVESRTQEQ